MVETFVAPNGESYFLAFASDGSGSAPRSREGSEMACRTVFKHFTESIAKLGSTKNFTEKEVVHCVYETVQEIRHHAYAESRTPKDYACTIIGVIIGPHNTICIQLGDGAIVISNRNIFGVVFRPDSGEYVNATFYLTDANGMENLKIQFIDYQLEQFALFTDGIQPLAVKMADLTPHVPFFEPMLQYMRNPKMFNQNTINADLAKFLGTEKVNQRTEDDKTLILATRL